MGEDFEIDIPKVWQYLAELIGPMMEDGTVPMTCLTNICTPIPVSCLDRFIAITVNEILIL